MVCAQWRKKHKKEKCPNDDGDCKNVFICVWLLKREQNERIKIREEKKHDKMR